MVILIHSSKTMRRAPAGDVALRPPCLIDQARRLDAYLKTLSPGQLSKVMSISPALAAKTHNLIAEWTAEPTQQSLAIDSFIGDIYSGLHANDLSKANRDYADRVLFILSGLYGVIRPYDGIYPYRLEMGYRLPDPAFASLYTFWGDAIAACLPKEGPIINLASDEYAQIVIRYIQAGEGSRVIVAPRFLTVNPKTGEPGFVVVHAKIARGAFARWLILNRDEDVSSLPQFDELGYRYTPNLSTPGSPAFVCETFGGKGLSIRLEN